MLRLHCRNVCGGLVPSHQAHLLAHVAADVLVLTEYRRQASGASPSPSLASLWPWQHAPATDAELRGVLLASRSELQPLPAVDLLGLHTSTEELRPRVAAAYLPAHDLTVIGVYMPYADGPVKEALWVALNRYAAAQVGERFVIIGDMNSGTAEEGESGDAYTPLPLEAMWGQTVDAWKEAARRDGRPASARYTWYSARGERRLGRRLDYAFLSPALESMLIDARHDHTVREQEISDHSDLIVELSLSGLSLPNA
jgi:exonuclease III